MDEPSQRLHLQQKLHKLAEQTTLDSLHELAAASAKHRQQSAALAEAQQMADENLGGLTRYLTSTRLCPVIMAGLQQAYLNSQQALEQCQQQLLDIEQDVERASITHQENQAIQRVTAEHKQNLQQDILRQLNTREDQRLLDSFNQRKWR